ncbi:hypothetical protein FZW96_20965 [Bacillus sp. BGMRC 2118]|nr:hypothetical protein FZW96_20965 [Bacillus sp. BGMRC 2118]
MEDKKKNAYKVLINQAFLDIKNSRNHEEAFRIAHAFHNLADLMTRDFEEMNEVNFWEIITGLEKDFRLNHYRELFESILDNDI